MRLIVTADDFGRSTQINQAVLKAHREGILTSASLMVAGSAAEEAVELARQTPTLAVGLHVVLVDGPAILSHTELPQLLNSSHLFPDAPIRLGLHYATDRTARKQLRGEVRAQFEQFARTGLSLSHVDAHQHLHLHPAVFPLLMQLAGEYQAAGIRLPRDNLRLALRYDHHGMLRKIAWGGALGAMSRFWAGRIPGGIHTAERCYGLFQSGQMSEQYLLRVLSSVSGRSAEIYFHPTIGARMNQWGPNETDFAALVSRAVRNVVTARNLQLSTYRDLSL